MPDEVWFWVAAQRDTEYVYSLLLSISDVFDFFRALKPLLCGFMRFFCSFIFPVHTVTCMGMLLIRNTLT